MMRHTYLMVDFTNSRELETLKRQLAQSPHVYALFAANFCGPENAAVRSHLLESVDASDFPLRQWLESLHTMQVWLDARGLRMSIEDQLGYVCCAGESAGAGAHLSVLPALVADMLEAYGCERATNDD